MVFIQGGAQLRLVRYQVNFKCTLCGRHIILMLRGGAQNNGEGVFLLQKWRAYKTGGF